MAENVNILPSLKEQAENHSKKLNTVFNKIEAIQISLCKTEQDTSSCLTEVNVLQRKINELEDRSWRNNVRLVKLPSGAEGDDLRGILQKMLPRWSPSLKDLNDTPMEIDRAHRIYSNNASRPRTMIFRLLRYTHRQAILEGARRAKPALPGGAQLHFFAEYTPGTTHEWQKYKELRAKLRQKGIELFLICPVILKVNSAEEASEALRSVVLCGAEEVMEPGADEQWEDTEMQ